MATIKAWFGKTADALDAEFLRLYGVALEIDGSPDRDKRTWEGVRVASRGLLYSCAAKCARAILTLL